MLVMLGTESTPFADGSLASRANKSLGLPLPAVPEFGHEFDEQVKVDETGMPGHVSNTRERRG
jgi:hypothetical protein